MALDIQVCTPEVGLVLSDPCNSHQGYRVWLGIVFEGAKLITPLTACISAT